MTTETPRQVVLTLPLPPAQLLPNAARRLHWASRGKLAAEYREVCGLMIRMATRGMQPTNGPTALDLTFTYRTKRTPDLDGLLSACKPLIDALVDERRLVEDRPEYLTEITLRVRVNPDAAPHVRVTLMEVRQ